MRTRDPAAAKLDEQADALEAKAKALRDRAAELQDAATAARPIFDRMIYSAAARCACGAGLAYDPAEKGDGPFKGPSAWKCGDIIRFDILSAEEQVAVKAATHDRGFPFAFYEIKSENQPSANGQTTRPVIEG